MAAIEKRSRKEGQQLDKKHHLHPFTDHKDLHERRLRIICAPRFTLSHAKSVELIEKATTALNLTQKSLMGS